MCETPNEEHEPIEETIEPFDENDHRRNFDSLPF